MSATNAGPSAGILGELKGLALDVARFELIDKQRTSDDGPTPGNAEVNAARGGPAQRGVGYMNGGSMGTGLIVLAVIGGLAFAATR